MVPVKYVPGFVPADFHGLLLAETCFDHVCERGPSEVMKQSIGERPLFR